MLPSELIERKRDGAELSEPQLREFLDGYARGEVAEYQMSAFLMAVFFQGLSSAELSILTRTIIDSGARLDFADGGPPPVDKHSTGGVGDKVSLVLAPLVAEAGLRVPMMSGRGLGHTGGTLDKLESIPGFRTGLSLAEFRDVLEKVGCAMIGQTPEIAPLDGRLYALRDVTGTVPSIPLIASSIISKKVAEGIEALVLDVKFGRGAFMTDAERASRLARVLVDLAAEEGVPATALLTEMESPLGVKVGHALEVREAIECLTGQGPPDLRELTLALSAELVASAGVEADRGSARERLTTLLDGGQAAERFARLIERQGGDPGVVDDPRRLPEAPVQRTYEADRDAFVAAVDARAVGLACIELGGGRRKVGEELDPAVGFEVMVRPGDRVRRGEPLVVAHARREEEARVALRRMADAVRLTEEAPAAGDEAAKRSAGWEKRARARITREGVEALS
ncbi:MAG: thymidine phosphorylase [Gemmatimonadota bacterium]